MRGLDVTSFYGEYGKKACLFRTIEDYGYKFVNGHLLNATNGEPFHCRNENVTQQKYEEFAGAITETVYELLETEAHLLRIPIPVDAGFDEPTSFFFASPDAWTAEKLLVFINGSGLVRAGQWSRKLIITNGLFEGSMLPHIHEGIRLGYGIVVLNTNENKVVDSLGRSQYIRGSEDPPSHAIYVWSEFIGKAKADRIAIVAHSAGGYTTVRLADAVTEDFKRRVFAVCLSDSAHVAGKSEGWSHLKKVTRNWTLSKKSLDTELCPSSPIRKVSAGTTSHDRTPHSVFRSMFRYLKEKEEDWMEEVSC